MCSQDIQLLPTASQRCAAGCSKHVISQRWRPTRSRPVQRVPSDHVCSIVLRCDFAADALRNGRSQRTRSRAVSATPGARVAPPPQAQTPSRHAGALGVFGISRLAHPGKLLANYEERARVVNAPKRAARSARTARRANARARTRSHDAAFLPPRVLLGAHARDLRRPIGGKPLAAASPISQPTARLLRRGGLRRARLPALKRRTLPQRRASTLL